MTFFATSPSLKRMIVGMLMMPNFWAVAGFVKVADSMLDQGLV